MLVLSRKVGEKIRIGPEIVVTVLAIFGNRIRLGISAPGSMPIFRSELVVPKGIEGNATTMQRIPG